MKEKNTTNPEMSKLIDQLVIANEDLAFQNEEKAK